MKKLLTIIAFVAASAAMAVSFADVDKSTYHGKTGLKDLTKVLDANFALIEANQIVAGATTVTGTEGANADLVLDADEGDDAADTWTLRSTASGNALAFLNDTSIVLSLSTAGVLDSAGGYSITDANGAAVFIATGFENNDASLVLDADQGDDAADTWTLNSSAATNELEIKNDATTVLSVTSAGRIKAAYGKGAAAGTGVSALEYGDGLVHQTVLAFSDVEIALVDNAGVGAHGSLKIYDMPEGAIIVAAAVSDLAVTKSSAGVNADWDGDFGLGTTAADIDASLATTEQDILPSTATPQAVAGVTTADGESTTAEHVIFNGTATAIDVYANFLVDDADQDVTSTPCNLVLNGTITITWINAGDN
jgi:hypothetical protein